MKTLVKNLFLVFFAQLISANILFAQNTHFLYVYPASDDVKPNEDKNSSHILDSIFNRFGVLSYKQSFTGAKTPEVANTYDIHASGNIMALREVLFATKLFTKVEVYEYPQINCNNPVAVNDPFPNQGASFGTSQLDMIDAQCAWSITQGDPNVLIGIIDTEFKADHEDMIGQFAYVWDPLNIMHPNSCPHGTAVSSIAGAKVNNAKGIAGIGNKCRIAGYVVSATSSGTGCQSNSGGIQSLPSSIWQGYLDGIKIINVSWTTTGLTTLATKEIVDNGTTLVVAAGNNPASLEHSSYANIPGVINVTGVNQENKIGPTNLARNEFIDICTPGGDALCARPGSTNEYSPSRSTSASAPFVSGTIGLMLSVNPCLSPPQIESIIKATADPVADGHLYPGLHGAGKLNAYKAVLAAQQVQKTGYDLHIQDTDYDFGQEPSAHSYPFWNSKDIWIRNIDDDGSVHENVTYGASSAYVYVRVRNIGCLPSSGNDILQLSWAKAATNLGWPWPWNGLNMPAQGPALGGPVGIAIVPVIQPGHSTIVKVQWNNVPNPADYQRGFIINLNEIGHFCLLARVVSNTDLMYFEDHLGSNPLPGNVMNNNNIAQKNISIMAMGEAEFESGNIGLRPVVVGIGNRVKPTGDVFNLVLKTPLREAGNSIVQDAEIRLRLDTISWSKWVNGGMLSSGINIIDETNHELLVTQPEARLEGIYYDAHELGELSLTANFLTGAYSDKKNYNYDIELFDGSGDIVGGERFEIIRPDRDSSELFFANLQNAPNYGAIASIDINEPAQYRWFSSDTLELIDTGMVVFFDSSQLQRVGLLEITANSDGYKDYYHFTNTPSTPTPPHYITTISPNPASSQISIEYYIDATPALSNAKITIRAVNNPQQIMDVNLNLALTNVSVNTSMLPTGVYIVTLYVDNIQYSNKLLVIQ